MTLPLIIFIAFMVWAFIEWGLKNPKSLGWTNFGLFMAYLAFILIIIYFGSAEKKKYERIAINNKIIMQE